MKKQQTQNLKGFRDFLPEEKRKRDYVTSKIKQTFELFGFEPLETPTLEYASLLLGKYGDEADKLVYSFEDRGGRQVALRYDQTVPTARVTAQYANQLSKFFRRYQIQNVFRADKPQKGRFREFTQCDIDIFGSTSPLADAEIIACTYFAFQNVGFKNIQLKINDRQVLMETLQPFATEKVDVMSIIQSIDKLDKLEPAQVESELISKGLTQESAKQALAKINQASQSKNLEVIIQNSSRLGVPKDSLVFSPTLARGLDYYTGMIFEVILPDYQIGSCGGGGRYDKLINQLGGLEMPAVGIAFGFDRMVEAASELNLIPLDNMGSQVMVAPLDNESVSTSLEVAAKLRGANIKTEIYPEIDKAGKQLKLANQKQIPFVVMIGSQEQKSNQVSLKNMKTGQQDQVTIQDAIAAIKS